MWREAGSEGWPGEGHGQGRDWRRLWPRNVPYAAFPREKAMP